MPTTTLDFTHRFVPAIRSGLPVLLLLHGTGGNEKDLMGIGHNLAPGAALLSPRGKVLENGMPRFFRRLSEGVFDIEDLKARALELADFVQSAQEQYRLGSVPMVAVGYSNGANIASGLILSRPDLLAGCCLLRPMIPFHPDPLPVLDGKQIFISAGRRDSTMPQDEPEQLAELYRSCGATVSLQSHSAGHALISEDITGAATWFQTTFLS
jgi:predicted esterase